MVSRVKKTITINPDVLKKWEKYCKDNDINCSRRIERYMNNDVEKI